MKTLIIQEGIASIDVRAFCYFGNLEVAILPQSLTFSNLKTGTKYTFAVRAGIKSYEGIVWSTYKESSVTVK